MAEKNDHNKLPVIQRDDLMKSHELFIGTDGKPVTMLDMFERFACRVPNANPDTPDEVKPDIVVEREFYEEDLLTAPDGRKIRLFGFKVPGQKPQFPSATMRLREGQIVHSVAHMKKNTHTIHHHGIEPTNFNDGVGHTAFEISGSYKYQFLVHQSGTYLYHCHKNTVLHFEMGMYGMLIVDPDVEGAPFADGGPGWVQRENSLVPYDVEAIWLPDEIDSRWHALINHMAGVSCPLYNSSDINAFEPTGANNPELHRFEPDLFLISGKIADGQPIHQVAASVKVGQTLLIRLLNAGYTHQEYSLDGLDMEVIEVDGRALGRAPKNFVSRPFDIVQGESFRLSTAQRWAMLVRPTTPGIYPFKVKFHHWISDRVLAEVETYIEVT